MYIMCCVLATIMQPPKDNFSLTMLRWTIKVFYLFIYQDEDGDSERQAAALRKKKSKKKSSARRGDEGVFIQRNVPVPKKGKSGKNVWNVVDQWRDIGGTAKIDERYTRFRS